jgi:queuine/archaeosine tRNA-ribosyltransferase
MTEGPHSQKRITKSIERTISWLGKFLSTLDRPSISNTTGETTRSYPTNILLPMVGGSSSAARRAFASTLIEPLEGLDAELLPELESLDAAFSGYLFPLAPLYLALSQTGQPVAQLSDLLRASLQQLFAFKPRIAYSPKSPHDILHLVRDVGVDAFDASWAQGAADVGVAFDFRFPVPTEHEATSTTEGKRNLGHNLYLKEYAMDFHRFANTLLDAQSASEAPSSEGASLHVCSCLACSPVPPAKRIAHSKLDKPIPEEGVPAFQAPYTRAYVHHLLHTHEMSALSFLTMHNFAVADVFMAGIRHVLQTAPDTFEKEIARFEAAYDGTMRVVTDSAEMWAQVERDRGKGRLKREKERELTKNAAEAGVDP